MTVDPYRASLGSSVIQTAVQRNRVRFTEAYDKSVEVDNRAEIRSGVSQPT